MRKIVTFGLFCVLAAANSQAQQLLGVANGNYAGTNGIYANPSSIADSRHGFYFNFFTVDGHLSNNYLRYNLPSSLGKWISEEDGEFQEQYTEEKLNGKPKLLNAGLDVRGPSFMLKMSPRHSFAITTRSRTFIQANNVSEEFARLMYQGAGEAALQDVLNTNTQFTFNVNSVAETGLTYARTVWEQDHHFLKAGITAKRLAGLYSAHIVNQDFSYTLKEDASGEQYLDVQDLDLQYGFSRPDFGVESDEILDALTFGNAPGKGWGFDVGFTYERRPETDKYRYTMDGEERLDASKNKYKYRLSVALMDIGGLKYNARQTQAYDITRRNITLRTEDFEESGEDDLAEVFNDALDVQPSERKTSFKTGLPTTLNINVDYKLTGKLYVNAAWIQGLRGKSSIAMRQSGMFAVTPRVEMKWLEVSFPLSLQNNYRNFAMGSMLRLGPFFAGSDNLAGALGIGKAFGADVYAGMYLPIFKGKKKDKDKDGVSNRNDVCRTTPGVWEFKGCPDTDGDGVQDSADSCATTAGVKQFNGCPDTDNDGIKDADDKCPTQAGIAQFGGCPDTDKDGIQDSEDKCPEVAGIAALNGCPDKDGDGITDAEDACPDAKGAANLKGCPDKDNDEVADKDDKCPDQYGTKRNNGCPEVKVQEKIVYVELTKEEEKVLKEAFDNLEFESGKAVIAASSNSSLDELADLLNARTNYRLLVSGHTDNVGKAATNLRLSRERAEAVKKRLVAQGIESSRIITEGFGSSKPVADNKTAAGRQKNRRVEMKVIK